jgi:peroxiredoxin
MMERLRSEAGRILTSDQLGRYTEIMVQAQGISALLSEEIAEELGLTTAQRERLQRLVEPTERKAKPSYVDLEENSAEQRDRPSRDRLGRSALGLLTPQQRKKWDKLGGRPFDFTRVRPIGVYAPEFEAPAAWINSEPLKMSDLRGQVVVVHFYAFGCGNCIANYPWYRQWQTDYAGKGVTLVGIHTPETEAEHDIESVRRKARAANLTFPILVDNNKRNWLAWSNKVWPSVYLVDKAGRVRNWRYGELNWKGMQGQQRMRARIDALLKEKTPATQPSAVPR